MIELNIKVIAEIRRPFNQNLYQREWSKIKFRSLNSNKIGYQIINKT